MLGIVTGLESEARAAEKAILRARIDPDRVRVRCEGPGLAAAERAAQQLIGAGATILLSFGLAGALSPEVTPGTLALPRHVLGDGGETLATDAAITNALAFALASAVRISREDLVSVGDVVGSAADKIALGARFMAGTVDMESLSVARAAHGAGLPFLVLRAVSDASDQAIPQAAQAGMGADGKVKPLAVLKALARNPRASFGVARLAHGTDQAMRALSRAARLAFPVLLVGR